MLYLLFTFLSLMLNATADDSGKIRALIRVERNEHGTQILRSDSQPIPSVMASKAVEESFLHLKTGDEAVVVGHITYHPTGGLETRKLSPFFVIEEIHPVSLSELGTASTKGVADPQVALNLQKPYEPLRLPVTTEVASAMTLTGAMLLMNALTTDQASDPQGRQDQRTAMIISAGTIATIVFLYDQLTGKTKP